MPMIYDRDAGGLWYDARAALAARGGTEISRDRDRAMELTQIRYFTALARALNFTRAAETCNVTQPALTRAIQKLEDELGGPLFHRERNLTQLTELGRVMLPLMEQAQAAAKAARDQAVAFRKRDSSPVRIGLDASLAAALLTSVVAELSRTVNTLDLSVQQDETAGLAARLLEGEIDAALLIDDGRIPERVHRWPLFKEGHVIVCPPDHALAKLDAVPISVLAGPKLLMRDTNGCALRLALDRMCAAAGVTPHVRLAASTGEQIAEMVKAGLGITLAGARRPISPPLVARPLEAGDGERRVVLAAPAGRAHGPTLALFIRLMRARSWADMPAAA